MNPERIPNIAGHSIFDEHSIIEEDPLQSEVEDTVFQMRKFFRENKLLKDVQPPKKLNAAELFD